MVKKEKIILTVGKRKNAKARAVITSGSGKIRINSIPLDIWGNEYLRMRIQEPLILAGDISKLVDINVNATGGGFSGQTDAIRMAIARGLLEFSKDKNLKGKFMSYDRNLLVFDPRRTEPHKPGPSEARRHKQRSKR